VSRRERGWDASQYGPAYDKTTHPIGALHGTNFLTKFTDNADDKAAFVFHSAKVYHGGAGTGVFGLGNGVLASKWICGTWNSDAAAASRFTQGTKAGVVLEVVGDDNDGFVVASTDVFSATMLTIVTDTVDGGGYTREWTYWNGTAWTAFTPLAETAGQWAAGQADMVFAPPEDWALTTELPDEGGIGAGYYAIKFAPTTAPDTTAGVATLVDIANPLRTIGSCAAGNVATLIDSSLGIPLQDSGEDTVVYASVPNAASFLAMSGALTRKAQTLGE